VIRYEFPLNERIRTLLRMEALYERVHFFTGKEQPLEHHAALLSLFEILDVAGRADLKSERWKPYLEWVGRCQFCAPIPPSRRGAERRPRRYRPRRVRVIPGVGQETGQELGEERVADGIKQLGHQAGFASSTAVLSLPAASEPRGPPSRPASLACVSTLQDGISIVRILRDSGRTSQQLLLQGVLPTDDGGWRTTTVAAGRHL
jgi:cell division protein ZapD